MSADQKQPLPLSYAEPDVVQRWNWPAKASVICALILPAVYYVFPAGFALARAPQLLALIVVGAGLISIVGAICLGAVGIYRSRQYRLAGWRIAMIGLLLGVANGAAFPMLHEYQAERYWHDYGNMHALVRCYANMRSIGQGIMLYSNENGGRFPTRLEELLLAADAEADEFICQFTNDAPASGPTTQAIAANLSMPGHLSYIYLGKGMTTATNPKCVVLYEPPTNHPADVDKINFLFADLHTEMLDKKTAAKLIQQLQAGLNPPSDERN